MAFQIKYVYDLVDKISPKLNKINGSLQKTQDKAAKVAGSAGRSFDKMQKQLKNVGQAAKDLGKSLLLKVTLPVGVLGGAFIKAASDAEEASAKFATVFQDVSKEAQNTAVNLSRSFGLSRNAAQELLGDTGDLLTGFGFSGKAALDLSKQVNELAVDLASFTNFSGGAEGASKALTKALLGERESIKSLGISILEEDVKRRVALLTAQGMTFETIRQAKAFATLQLAQEQSKNAIGDFARTSGGFANQMRIFRARLNDVSVSFGKIMLPVALRVLQALKRLIEFFDSLSSRTKKLILITAGLAAVLGPLLVVFGVMATAIAAIGPIAAGVAAVISGLSVVAVAVSAAFDVMATKIKAVWGGVKTATANTLSFIKDMVSGFVGNIITAINKPFEALSSAFNKVKSLFGGADIGNINIAAQEALKSDLGGSLDTNINSQSNFSGDLRINLNNLPAGSNAQLKTEGTPNFNVGMNTIFAGSAQ